MFQLPNTSEDYWSCVFTSNLEFFQIIVHIFFLVMNIYVFNQSHGHCLLSDALHVTITMALKLKTKLEWHPIWLISWKMIYLWLQSCPCNVLDGFLSTLTKYEKKKTYNMLSLMLDPTFKNFRLFFPFIGWKQVVFMVKDYDRRSLFWMLLKCNHVVHPILEFKITIN